MCEYKIEKILGKIEKVGFFSYDVVKTNEYNLIIEEQKKMGGYLLERFLPKKEIQILFKQ